MSNNWDRYLKEAHPRKHSKNPSFSSVLLDEVFRSIDEDNQVPSSSKRKSINNIEVTSFWDNESISFSTTSRSNSSDSSFSSGVSFSSDSSYKSSKPIYSNPRNSEDFKIESKSRAMKMYANLKKVKQPISPGGRLSSFISSLFTSESSKKMKNKNDWENSNATFTSEISKKKKNKNDGMTKNAILTCVNARKMIKKNDGVIKHEVNDATSSCSPTSSSSRSCMRKSYAINSKARFDNGATRKVRFSHASSIILDDDSQSHRYKTNVGTKGLRNVESYMEEDDSEDGLSDCSDDLFEIDHLGMFGNEIFCDELPVYGTTHVSRSCLY